jgi:hypothetical protein
MKTTPCRFQSLSLSLSLPHFLCVNAHDQTPEGSVSEQVSTLRPVAAARPGTGQGRPAGIGPGTQGIGPGAPDLVAEDGRPAVVLMRRPAGSSQPASIPSLGGSQQRSRGGSGLGGVGQATTSQTWPGGDEPISWQDRARRLDLELKVNP